MRKIKLGEVCKFQSGGTPSRSEPTYYNGDIPWITTVALNGNVIDNNNAVEFITQKAILESAAKIVPAYSVMVGTRVGVGKVAINCVPMSTSQDIISLIDVDGTIDKKYLCRLIQSQNDYLNLQARGATIKGIKIDVLSEIDIPAIPLEEQKRISSTFDIIDNLIVLSYQQLAKLDELVKSRFIELFGDYDLSHAQSDWKYISEIGKVMGGATPKSNIEEYWDGEYRWITPAELSADSGYIYDSVRKLTKAGVDSCSLQEMPIDTVILSSRAPIGKVAIAGNTFYCNQGFKNIICNKEILPRYLYTVLLLNTEYLNSLGRGATFKEISKSIVENIRIPVPPIELQEQFAAFVEQADKSRFIELFGNPLDGTAKYPLHQVGEVAEAVDPQPSHRTPPIEEGGIPYVSIKDCDYKTGRIDFDGARKVSRTVLAEHLDRYTLQEGDFVIGKIGTIGNPVFVPVRNDYTLSANVVLVQPNSKLVSPWFLKYSFESEFVEQQFAEAKNSTSQAAFGIQKVRSIEIMNPDLDTQRRFEIFVKQADKSKLAVLRNFEIWDILKKLI